ncbi:NACHT domain-containing protein [Kitasatospora cineracea]
MYGVHNASRLLTLEFTKALATALGRDPAEVVPIWTRAKEARDRATASEQQAARPRLASWADLPLPTLALRNLLEAQSTSVDRLPYDILDVKEPPLSAIYVRQQMRAAVPVSRETGPGAHGPAVTVQEASDPQATSQDRDTVLPLNEIFGRPGHILVTGEPGSGKSTLTSHLTWLLARIWLREESSGAAMAAEPLVPLRIAARTLVAQAGSWSTALCHATRQSLGHSLVADPDAGLFAGRVQGARWLVMVDGLDEIADRQARTQIIRAIAQHSRSDGAYRFLVTTRPLPEKELTPLRSASFSSYRMEPFNRTELRDFATQWFRAQGNDQDAAAAAAARFLQETEDGRLNELLQNPLLATIAAVSATIDPRRSLPANRLSLYQQFFEHLMSRDLGQDGKESDLATWLRQSRQELIEAIARHRIESDGSLMAAARQWVRERLPAGVEPAGRSEPDVRQLLLDTGLLVSQGDDLRFLHHSFAEFLSAQSYAKQIPSDFPDLDTWARKGMSETEHTLAVFTFAMWSQRIDCNADLIIDHLLHRTSDNENPANLAGLLVAEGVQVGPKQWSAILQRLEDGARSHFDASDQRQALSTLSALADRPGAADRLHALASSGALSTVQRLGALKALIRVSTPAEAEVLLSDILTSTYAELPTAAKISATISTIAQEAVLERVRSVQLEVGADTWETVAAAEALEVLGKADAVKKLALEVLTGPTARPTDLQRAARAWLKASHGQCADEIVELALHRPTFDHTGRDLLARTLEESGEPAAAARLAETILRDRVATARQLKNAADIWSRVHGKERPEVILDALQRTTPAEGQPAHLTAWLTQAAAESGETGLAIEWARQILSTSNTAAVEVAPVIAAWLTAEGSSAAATILELLHHGELIPPHERPKCASEMLDAGATVEAATLAKLALNTPLRGKAYYEEAVGILIKAQPDECGPFLERHLAEVPECDPEWMRGVLAPLTTESIDSFAYLAATLAHRLLAAPTTVGRPTIEALLTLVEVEGLSYVPTLLTTLKSRSQIYTEDLRDIARGLASLGQREAALDCWRHALELLRPPDDQELALLHDILAADAGMEAATWLREMIKNPQLSGLKRLRLQQMLAWLEPAIEPGPAQRNT